MALRESRIMSGFINDEFGFLSSEFGDDKDSSDNEEKTEHVGLSSAATGEQDQTHRQLDINTLSNGSCTDDSPSDDINSEVLQLSIQSAHKTSTSSCHFTHSDSTNRPMDLQTDSFIADHSDKTCSTENTSENMTALQLPHGKEEAESSTLSSLSEDASGSIFSESRNIIPHGANAQSELKGADNAHVRSVDSGLELSGNTPDTASAISALEDQVQIVCQALFC